MKNIFGIPILIGIIAIIIGFVLWFVDNFHVY